MDSWLKLVYGWGYDKAQPAQAAQNLPPHTDDPYIACALGDDRTLHHAMHADPELVNRPGGPLSMPPLVAVTFSSLVQLPAYAEPLRHCCLRLLGRGADPNQTWIDPAFPKSPLSALYGAAGRNHDAEMTRILLEAGANPNDNESLYHSVESSDLTCTRLLLDAGAKVTGTNALGRVMDFDNLEGLRSYCWRAEAIPTRAAFHSTMPSAAVGRSLTSKPCSRPAPIRRRSRRTA